MNPHPRLLELRERFRPRLTLPRAQRSAELLIEEIERAELRAWRKDAEAYRSQRFAKIAAAGSEWPRRVSKKLRHLVANGLASARLQYAALYDALGASGNKEAALRFARDHLLDLPMADTRLNPRAPIHEPIRLKAVLKADGSYRPAFAYGPFMRARQELIASILRQLLRGKFRFQALERGASRRAVVSEISRLALDPAYEVVATADIKNCYGTINPQYLIEFLPFPVDAIHNTILQPLNRTGDQYERVVVPEHMAAVIWPRPHARIPVSQPRRGIPQGSSCSPMIVHAVLEAIVGSLRTTEPIIQWADNLLIFGRTSREAVDLLSQLERCLGEHSLRGIPAGPLTLGQRSISRIRDGFSFIGVDYRIEGERVTTSLSSESRGRFLDRLDERIDLDEAIDDGKYTSAMNYVFHQWGPQAVTDDAPQMKSRALARINEAAERDGYET